MARLALVSGGFDVVLASDGIQALEKLDGQDFEVIVLDLQMPRMDGRTFYRELRVRNFHTPVIILSAFGAERARAELAAERAISKPFDPSLLIEAVKVLARTT